MSIMDKNIDLFSDGSTPPAPEVVSDSVFSYGEWYETHDDSDQNLLSVSYALSGTLPTKLEIMIEVAIDGVSRGHIPAINFISSGVIDIDDAVFEVPVADTDSHVVDAPIRPYQEFRIGFKRTGGDGTTKVLAVGDLFRVD